MTAIPLTVIAKRGRTAAALTARLRRVALLALDVDGVLTDGRILIGPDGSEWKAFDVRDGFGLRLLMDGGLAVCVITGRRSPALEHRCRELGIAEIYQGARDKVAVIRKLLADKALVKEQVAFVGDDLLDLPLMGQVGLGIAVADAHPLLIAAADVTTMAPGGRGAVREVCEALLEAHGLWQPLVERYRHATQGSL